MTACSGTSSAAPEASAAKESSVKTTSEAPAPAVKSNSLTNTWCECSSISFEPGFIWPFKVFKVLLLEGFDTFSDSIIVLKPSYATAIHILSLDIPLISLDF